MKKQSVIYEKELGMDIYTPDVPSFPVIVYFHGGGIEGGDKADSYYVEMAERFVTSGYGFISVNYSLYPNTKFPEYLYECASAVRYVKDHLGIYGGNGTIYVAGQSAGAYITLMLCFNHEYLDYYGVKNEEIAGWISDSAQTTTHFNVQKYEKGRDPWLQRIDEYAPLYYINQETRFSSLFLDYYEEDMACRVEQNRLLFSSIRFYHPEADITAVLLPGTHCHGSTKKDEDGEYRFVKEVLKWFGRNK